MVKKVLKFGGTSVGSSERILHVAKIIKKERSLGNKIIVVVSAMAGKTNELIKLSEEISEEFNKREMDVLLSSGEQVTSALLSGALTEIDVKAKSWLNWQIPILTEGENTNSRIDIMSETMPVEHLGYVSDSELEKLYAKAFGFIFPSWYEGFGLPVVEAMNQGTPVITTLESSLREIAENYAYTFDPTSPKELTQKMLTLEDNPKAWNKLQKLSIKRADCFTWEKTAQMVHSILP